MGGENITYNNESKNVDPICAYAICFDPSYFILSLLFDTAKWQLPRDPLTRSCAITKCRQTDVGYIFFLFFFFALKFDTILSRDELFLVSFSLIFFFLQPIVKLGLLSLSVITDTLQFS